MLRYYAARPYGPGPGWGRGQGFGFGRGAGRGWCYWPQQPWCRGWGGWGPPPWAFDPYYGPEPYYEEPPYESPQEEMAALKEEETYFLGEIEAVQKRLAALEKEP
jgi:hypothetical protein